MGVRVRSKLLLMRCGATEWDRLDRVQGSTDLPLCDAGRKDVVEQVKGLAGVKLGCVMCGPDEASRETARILAKATGARVQVEAGLGELHLGLWEGLLASSLENKCWAGKVFLTDGAGVVAPGASESLEQYRDHVAPVFAGLVGRRRGPVGMVLRPIALGVIRCELDGGGLDKWCEMGENAAPLEWYDPSGQRTSVTDRANGVARGSAVSFFGRVAAAM